MVSVPPPQPVLVQAAVSIRDVSYVLRRAFVAGQDVRLTGLAPNGCGPALHLDGRLIGPVATSGDGQFDIGVATHDLAPGQHRAEVYCTTPVALLVRTTFWVAAPESGSNLLFVALSSLLVLCALGWVALRTIAGSSMAPLPSASRRE